MTKTFTALALVLSLGSVAYAADAPVYSDDNLDESQPQFTPQAKGSGDVRINAPSSRKTDTQVYAPNDRRESGTARVSTGGSTSSTGPIHFAPTITVHVAPVIGTTSQQSGGDAHTSGAVPPPAIVPVPVPVAPRPVCRPGMIGNLGGDPMGLGRPVFANVRVAPTAAAPNVPGPDGAPVILPPGAPVAVCGGGGSWALVEVCSTPPFPGQPQPQPLACVRGFTYSRFVIAL